MPWSSNDIAACTLADERYGGQSFGVPVLRVQGGNRSLVRLRVEGSGALSVDETVERVGKARAHGDQTKRGNAPRVRVDKHHRERHELVLGGFAGAAVLFADEVNRERLIRPGPGPLDPEEKEDDPLLEVKSDVHGAVAKRLDALRRRVGFADLEQKAAVEVAKLEAIGRPVCALWGEEFADRQTPGGVFVGIHAADAATGSARCKAG